MRSSLLPARPPLSSRSACSAFLASRFTRWAACAAALALAACNPLRAPVDEDGTDPNMPGPDGQDPTPRGTLTITPPVSSLTIDGTPQTLSFKASGSVYGDVTSTAIWTMSDSSIGALSAGKLTVPAALDRGGSFKVYASYQGLTATATVNLKVVAPDVLDASAPADAKDYFGGPTGGPAPQLAYPFDGTMMAPNVLQLVVQWKAGAGQSVYRVQVEGTTYARSFYVGSSACPGGNCTLKVDDRIWSSVGHSSLGQEVKLTIWGSGSKGGPVGQSPAASITFSPEDIRGGLYYFSPTIKGIKRVPLGASKPVDFITNGDETSCAGCHAVSRDGKQVAVEFGSGQTRVGSTVVDGAMPRMRNFQLRPTIAWNFAWFNPTGDKLITNWSGQLTVRDPKTGAVLESVTQAQIGGAGGAMPEWSPDGKWIAFVRQPTLSMYDFELENAGDIVVMPYNNGAFGSAIELVHGIPNKEVHFWPSWSPDSKWLVFNTLDCPGGCQQYDAHNTRLRLVRAIDDAGNPASGATPIELVAGTHQKYQSNNWPKFAPFLQSGRYVFIVYSARYGWGWNSASSNPQLFMFGLDLDKAKTGADPSFQPVWLPFQEKNTGNHSAIWTTDVACLTDKDCPSEFQCTANMCVPRIG